VLNCSKAFDSKFANSSGVMLSVFKLKVTNCLLTQRTEFSLHPRSIQKTLFSYLSEFGTEPVPVDYLQVVENHFFLIDFLDKLEQNNEL
ncbi:MAG: hypothetical protein ACJA1C_001952, partial [Crocinitomicaceae bacterium]